MMRRKLFLAGVFASALAIALSGCGGSNISEDPVQVTTPQGVPVAALAMTSPRANAAAIRLRDGRVLICGGNATGTIGGVVTSAEIYDPSSQTFSPTGNMTVPREGQTITMLQDGRVLLTGGAQNIGFRSELASAEIYDPAAGTFTATGSMSIPREGHTATLLRDGRVLVVGGSDNGTHTLDSAEVYIPASGAFTGAGHLNQPRIAHTATLLLSGKVLIAGGGRGDRPGGYIAYDTAEIFEPITGAFGTLNAHMVNARVGAASVLLSDGRALIVGGKSGQMLMAGFVGNIAGLTPLNTAETYDPEARRFTPTGPMSAPHYLPTATKLDDGNVLVVGGWKQQGPTVVGMTAAELYVDRNNHFSSPGPTNVARLENTATLLPDGEVLIAGGIDANSNITSSVEFYSPRQHSFLLIPEAGAPAGPVEGH